MSASSRTVTLAVANSDLVKRLKDPYSDDLYHLEAILPFGEVVKLDKGNANLRPPDTKKPAYKGMLRTVEDEPQSFHVRNRGITYLCERFNFDNSKGTLTVTIPAISEDTNSDTDQRFGVGDGGHTYAIIHDTVRRAVELKAQNKDWQEPFVRVHFIAGYKDDDIQEVVEALNTSAQVRQVSLDEYADKFEELKQALIASGFDINLIAFRENEDKEWAVEEIIQRMACFLKDRWTESTPSSVYRNKSKALELYTNDSTRGEFRGLYPVIKDIITLPEYMQSVLSEGKIVKRNSLSQIRVVKLLPKKWTRPGTMWETEHRLDLAALLPMASAFRELLRLNNGKYEWRFQPEKVFRGCAQSLYNVLTSRLMKTRNATTLGSDTEYWSSCAMIVMREKDKLAEK